MSVCIQVTEKAGGLSESGQSNQLGTATPQLGSAAVHRLLLRLVVTLSYERCFRFFLGVALLSKRQRWTHYNILIAHRSSPFSIPVSQTPYFGNAASRGTGSDFLSNPFVAVAVGRELNQDLVTQDASPRRPVSRVSRSNWEMLVALGTLLHLLHPNEIRASRLRVRICRNDSGRSSSSIRYKNHLILRKTG
jgi:hypothetical protein